MSLPDLLLQVADLIRRIWVFEPWLVEAVFFGVALIAVAGISKRLWVRIFVCVVFLAASAAYSIYLIALGWLLALLGLLMALAGAIWKWRDRSSKASGALVWPGLGLLAAPLVNIYMVMPMLRHFIK